MLEIGQHGPDFSLPGVDGKTYSLSELLKEYRAAVVIFSCNHCPYVRAWEGRMMDIQQNYQDKGVIVVAINPNDAVRYPEDDFAHMQQRAQSENFNFLYLRDESQDIARSYGATHTPHVYLLDSNGVLRYRGAIDDNYDDPAAVQHRYLQDALDTVLAGNSPEITTTGAIGCTIKWKG